MNDLLPRRSPSRGALGRTMFALLVAGLVFARAGFAVTLDWNLVSWPQYSLTNSFDIDATNPGNDVRITITGDTQYFNGKNPQIDNVATGGFGTTAESLDLATTFDTLLNQWTVTVEFLYASGVQDVSFIVFDVDCVSGGGPPADQLRNIYATAAGSTNLVAPVITGSVDNLVSGSGVNQWVDGIAPNQQSSADGNVTINYSTNVISSFTFTFGDNTNQVVGARLVSQHFSLYDISYSKPVPEVGVVLGPCAIAAAAVGLILVRKFRAS